MKILTSVSTHRVARTVSTLQELMPVVVVMAILSMLTGSLALVCNVNIGYNKLICTMY